MRKALLLPLLLAFSVIFHVGLIAGAAAQTVSSVPAGATVCSTYRCTVGGRKGTCTRFCKSGSTCGPNDRCIPAAAPIKVRHTADCPTVEKLFPRGKGFFKYNAHLRVFSRDCIITRPNGQIVRRKQGELQSPIDRIRPGKWKGTNEATEEEVTLGGKG